MTRYVAFEGHIFRMLAFQVFVTAWLYNIQYLFVPGKTDSYGGRRKYLTFLNTSSLMFYTGYSAITSALRISWLVKIRDLYYASVVFPFSCLVTTLFWSLFMINEELVFPKAMSAVTPKYGWYNHVVHSGPLAFALLDMLFTEHQYPTQIKGISLTAFLGLNYIAWILWIAFKANIWVYPVLEKLSATQLAVFLVVVVFATSLIYLLGDRYNRFCKRLVCSWTVKEAKLK